MRKIFLIVVLNLLAETFVLCSNAYALTANKIWMQFRHNGRYRVYVNYTVPALKEQREVWVEFSQKKEAERYYFDILRGADFYLPDAKNRGFTKAPYALQPW